MKLRVGFITIGQSPRTDVMNDLSRILTKNIEVAEKGVLDGFTREEIMEKFSPEPGHTVYVSRLRDGSSITMSKEKILPVMQERIKELGEITDLIVILCSGDFPRFESRVPIIYPEKLLKAFVEGISLTGRLAVFIPLPQQVVYAYKKWSSLYPEVTVVDVSPYSANLEEFSLKARKLVNEDPQLVVMDCVGYTFEQRKTVQEVLEKPVVTTRGVIARALNELAG